jgi:hypothetical protein
MFKWLKSLIGCDKNTQGLTLARLRQAEALLNDSPPQIEYPAKKLAMERDKAITGRMNRGKDWFRLRAWLTMKAWEADSPETPIPVLKCYITILKKMEELEKDKP